MGRQPSPNLRNAAVGKARLRLTEQSEERRARGAGRRAQGGEQGARGTGRRAQGAGRRAEGAGHGADGELRPIRLDHALIFRAFSITIRLQPNDFNTSFNKVF